MTFHCDTLPNFVFTKVNNYNRLEVGKKLVEYPPTSTIFLLYIAENLISYSPLGVSSFYKTVTLYGLLLSASASNVSTKLFKSFACPPPISSSLTFRTSTHSSFSNSSLSFIFCSATSTKKI